jgi:hypothetical protein
MNEPMHPEFRDRWEPGNRPSFVRNRPGFVAGYFKKKKAENARLNDKAMLASTRWPQTLGFKVMSILIGVVFGFAGISIMFSSVAEYKDITFGVLLFAAPLFTVYLLGLFCFWFTRLTETTNEMLAGMSATLRSIEQELKDSQPSE